MRLLLVSVNREKDPWPVFPIGLAYLAGPLRRAGHEPRVLDLCFDPDPSAAVAEALAEVRPDAVLVSVRNLENVAWPSVRSYVDAVRDVVAPCLGKAVVVLGGAGFSVQPRELLDATGADYGVVGEGEQVLPALLSRLAAGLGADGTPGVLTRGGNGAVPAARLETIGTPDRSLFDLGRYLGANGSANVQTRRGCPFRCVYCTYPLLEGRRVRPRPVAEVVAELRSLVDDHGIDYVEFCDAVFNYPQEHARALCEAMIAAGLELSWSAFVNPGYLDAALVDLMVRAGCDAFELGTDSGSDPVLAGLGKSFRVADVRRAAGLCRAAGVATAHYLLLGGPGETEETFAESVALMDELAPTAVIVMVGIRVYAGTELHAIALREGIVAEGQSLLEPVFYPAEPERRRLEALASRAAATRVRWIVPGIGVNSRPAMLDFLRRRQPRGPLWRGLARRRRPAPAPPPA